MKSNTIRLLGLQEFSQYSQWLKLSNYCLYYFGNLFESVTYVKILLNT
jgi:hypothetical protein